MRTPSLSELPPGLVDRVREARRAADALDRELSDTILRLAGIHPDAILEDTLSGLRYRITHASANVSQGWPSVHVRGKRLWKTGRKAGREAYTDSFISFTNARIVPESEL